jgi:hypothetical protein
VAYAHESRCRSRYARTHQSADPGDRPGQDLPGRQRRHPSRRRSHQFEGLRIDTDVVFCRPERASMSISLHRFFERDDIDVQVPSVVFSRSPGPRRRDRYALLPSGPLRGRWLENSARVRSIRRMSFATSGSTLETVIWLRTWVRASSVSPRSATGSATLRLFYDNDLRFLRQFRTELSLDPRLNSRLNSRLNR